jgi:gas vesicle protein
MSDNESGSAAAEKLTFLLIGAGIGATLALLFAPKSGRELREDIADVTRRGIDAAGEGVRRASDTASDLYDTGRTRAGEYYGTARDRVGDAYGSARQRVGDAYGTARDRVSDAYGTAKDRVADHASTVSEVASRQKDQIAAAIEAGKQAYQEEKRRSSDTGRAVAEGEGGV